MTVDSWLAAALADADRRGLPALRPLLETLARSTTALRRADLAHRAAAPASGPPLPLAPADRNTE